MVGPEFPAVEHETLADPPLRAMLGQVQFPPILQLQKGVEAVADFQESIRDSFPEFEAQQQIQLVLAPGSEQPPPATSVGAFRFTHESGNWSALLAPTALTLEASSSGPYSSFDEFAELFVPLWRTVVEHFRPARVVQQGLRYVDHIEAERTPTEWQEWINPVLLGPAIDQELSKDLSQFLSEMLFEGDGGRLAFRHGVRPAGPQNLVGYLLDFDCVHTESIDVEDVDFLMERFNASHEQLYRFFRWCVTDRAIEEFKHVVA